MPSACVQANMPEPNVARQAAELFSALPDQHMHAAELSMQCVINIVRVGLAEPQVLVPALFQFLFGDQGSGWSVAGTLSSYARDIYAQGDGMHDVPLQFISSLMLLVGKSRDIAAESIPAPSFLSAMHSVSTPGKCVSFGKRKLLYGNMLNGF